MTRAAAAGRRRGSIVTPTDCASTMLTVATWIVTVTAGISAFCVQLTGQSYHHCSIV